VSREIEVRRTDIPGVSFRAPHRFRDFKERPLDHLIAAGELGDVVSLAFPFFTVYLLAGPQCVRRMLQENHQNYRQDPALIKVLRSTIGDSVLTAEGETWRGSRERAKAVFSASERNKLSAIIVAQTGAMIDRWRTHARRAEPIELEREFMVLNLGIAASIVCGVNLGGRVQPLASAIFEAFECLNARILNPMPLPRWVPSAQNRRLDRTQSSIKQIVGSLIDEAAAQKHPCSRLMQDSQVSEASTKRAQLIEEVVALMGTASSTTAAALVWACYLLTKNPEIESSVQQEAAALSIGAGMVEYDPSGFEEIRTTILETLRLYPPAWVKTARSLARDYFGSVEIPAGARVVVSPFVTHRLKRLWSRPEVFDPSRFARQLSVKDLPGYFPFGYGPRRCVGEHFAMMQMSLTLAMIARAFRLVAQPGQSVEPRVAFTLRTNHGFWVLPVERTPA
jgi:cytochrome P450